MRVRDAKVDDPWGARDGGGVVGVDAGRSTGGAAAASGDDADHDSVRGR